MSGYLKKYAEFAPTSFDTKGRILHDRQDWLVVPVMRTRDSSLLEQSNFEAALDRLGGESEDVEVHRFNHWGPGWYEIILVRPGSDAERIAEEIAALLENYPALDEDDLSQRKWEAASDTWENMATDDRIRLCKEAKESIFAARRDNINDIPLDVRQEIFDKYIYK